MTKVLAKKDRACAKKLKHAASIHVDDYIGDEDAVMLSETPPPAVNTTSGLAVNDDAEWK